MADCCQEIRAELAALKAEVAKLKPVNEASLIEKIKNVILPIVFSKIFEQINPLNNKISGVDGRVSSLSGSFQNTLNQMNAAIADSFQNTLNQMNAAIADARNTAVSAKGVANTAKATADTVEDIARNAAREASLASGLSRQAKNVADTADAVAKGADLKAAKSVIESGNAIKEVTGLKGLVSKFGSKLDDLAKFIGKVEKVAGDALIKAAKAIGISEEALKIGGRALGKALEVAGAIANILTLIEQIAILNVLGGRIDAVERQVDSIASSVSRILGKLLGLQNRIEAVGATVPPVRDLADRAARLFRPCEIWQIEH